MNFRFWCHKCYKQKIQFCICALNAVASDCEIQISTVIFVSIEKYIEKRYLCDSDIPIRSFWANDSEYSNVLLIKYMSMRN